MAASVLADLQVLNTDTVNQAVSQMGSLKFTRLVVTDTTCKVVYDSSAAGSKYTVFPEIVQALNEWDVFTWNYKDGIMRSCSATPIYSRGILSGCVYMTEYDSEQGALIRSLQMNVLWISIVLELVLILFSIIFANGFSGRLRKIRNSMRIIRAGDYSHRLVMGGNDELTLLGDEFNELTERLQTSERKRRQFVSDASHELKTPLASIKLLTDSILQNEMDTPTVREFVTDIGNEAERLNRISQKLLALSKADTEVNTELEILQTEPILQKVVKMLSGIAKESNITITTEIIQDKPILIAEDDLYEILFNLIENGIKYNITGGTLRILVKQEMDNTVICVTDSGMGIPEKALPFIFERFYRVDKARSRKSGGSGLGLAIVKNLIERHHGTIEVCSKEGKGTNFRVTFPIFDTEDAGQ